jgi:hypothetical protein
MSRLKSEGNVRLQVVEPRAWVAPASPIGASGKSSDEQHQKDLAERLCHIRHQRGHVARNCPQNKKRKGKGGKVAAVSDVHPEDDMSEEGF